VVGVDNLIANIKWHTSPKRSLNGFALIQGTTFSGPWSNWTATGGPSALDEQRLAFGMHDMPPDTDRLGAVLSA